MSTMVPYCNIKLAKRSIGMYSSVCIYCIYHPQDMAEIRETGSISSFPTEPRFTNGERAWRGWKWTVIKHIKHPSSFEGLLWDVRDRVHSCHLRWKHEALVPWVPGGLRPHRSGLGSNPTWALCWMPSAVSLPAFPVTLHFKTVQWSMKNAKKKYIRTKMWGVLLSQTPPLHCGTCN